MLLKMKMQLFSRKTAIWLTIVSGLIILPLGIVVGTRVYHQIRSPQKLNWKGNKKTETDNLADPRPLKDKAKQFGHYVAVEYPGDLKRFNTLKDLITGSDAVLIGKAMSNLSDVDGTGTTLTINYQLKVEHVYKGNVSPGQTLVVSLPGGMRRFSDGTSAEIHTPWLKKMMNGVTYLLCLKRSSDQSWTLTAAPRGLFEIPTTAINRNVTSHSLLDGDPMRAYDQMEVVTFLRSVKAIALESRPRG